MCLPLLESLKPTSLPLVIFEASIFLIKDSHIADVDPFLFCSFIKSFLSMLVVFVALMRLFLLKKYQSLLDL